MTTLVYQEPAVVNAMHLAAATGCSVATLNNRISTGQFPPCDARGRGNAKLWRLSTLNAWRPDVAAAAAELVARKPIPLYRPSDSLPTAA